MECFRSDREGIRAQAIAVDGEFKERTVAQTSLVVEPKADCSNLWRLQGSLGAQHLSCVPCFRNVAYLINVDCPIVVLPWPPWPMALSRGLNELGEGPTLGR
jgi:hypothetical protein